MNAADILLAIVILLTIYAIIRVFVLLGTSPKDVDDDDPL
jgi:hypothetical protein